MGCSKDKYFEPPKENKINDYLKKKEKIINKHLANATLPTSDEIQLISKIDIEIFEFLERNIKSYEEKMMKTRKKYILKEKLEYYKKKKEEYDGLNFQWDELLGYQEEVKKMEKEKEEVIQSQIKHNYRRKIYEEKEEQIEEEEEEENYESKDLYYNSPFFEQNPKMIGEDKENFHSLIHSEKNEEDLMKEKYPFMF